MLRTLKYLPLYAALSVSLASPALGQQPKLIEAGRNEGKVVVYGSLETEMMGEITKAFQKKTGINVEDWRGSVTKVMDRALAEYRAGKPLFDLILANDSPMQIMLKDGIFAKYDSPSAKDFPKEAIDPNLGPRYRSVLIGILYNKSMINPTDAPKSLDGILDVRFTGKVVMPDPTQHTTTIQWLASLDKIMAKGKADKFIRDLAARRPHLVESLTPSAEIIGNGERPIGLAYMNWVVVSQRRGAPVDYVRMERMLGDGHFVGLSNKAPHSNAAKAFIDFFLGDESMRIMASMGEFVNRKGIYPPIPDADKIQYVQMVDLDKKGFAEKRKEYQRIFLQ